MSSDRGQKKSILLIMYLLPTVLSEKSEHRDIFLSFTLVVERF